MTTNLKSSRKRLVYIEYLLLKAIKDGSVVSFEKNTISGLDGKATTTTLKAISLLAAKGLINKEGITAKGKVYLKSYPLPKIKHMKLFNMTPADSDYLVKMDDSDFAWTSSRLLADKASMLFKLVRYGYAVGMKNRGTDKLTKDDIMPTPSLTIPSTRDQYFFKITKKGRDYLNLIK